MAEDTDITLLTQAEIEVNPEIKVENTRGQILDALNFGRNSLNSYITRLEASGQPSPELEKYKWVQKSIEDAVKESLEKNKDTVTIEFPDKQTGETFKQEEGIPIEEIIGFLNEIKKFAPEGSRSRKEFEEQIAVLENNNKSYAKAHDLEKSDINEKDPVSIGNGPHAAKKAKILHERKDLEAKYASIDYRAAGNEEGDQARMAKDWKMAEETLANRLELIIPPRKPEIEPNPAPEVTTPETASSGGIPEDAILTDLEEPDVAYIPDEALTSKHDADEEPEEITPKPKVIEVVIASRERDVYSKSRELASKLVQKEMDRGNPFNPLGWGRRIGLYLLRPYWEQRLTQEIVTQTEVKRNAYSTLDLAQSRLVLRDLLRRHTENLVINTEANREAEHESAQAKVQNIKERHREGLNESGKEVSVTNRADVFEATGPVKKTLEEEILKRVIKGEITDEAGLQTALAAFVTGHQADADFREFMQLFGGNANQFNRLTQYFATDLLKVGQDLKADLGEITDEKLATIEKRVKILLANPTKWGAESQAYFGVTDRFVARIASHRPGAILNASTIGAGTAMATALLTRGSTALQFAGLTVPCIGAIFGGGAAYFRKRQEYSANRQVYNLESAYSETPADQRMERRAEIFKKSNYKTRKATDLLDALQRSVSKPAVEIQETDRTAIIDAIADISSRMSFNDEQHAAHRPTVDLITFENRYQVEQTRAKLDSEMILARRALRNSIKAGGVNISDEAAKTQAQEMIDAAAGQRLDAIRLDYAQKNSQFNVEARSASLRYAATVAAFGFAGGLISQEGLALVARAVPGLTEIPLVGGFLKPGQTTLERGLNSVASRFGHSELGTGPANLETFQNLFHNNGGSVDIDSHVRAQINPNHTISLFDRTTGQPIPNQPLIFSEANGHVVTTGNPNQLPEAMRSWVRVSTLNHSLQEQIQQAAINTAKTGNPELISTGNARIDVINGKDVTVFTVDQAEKLQSTIGGSVSPDSTLHLSGDNLETIKKIGIELKHNGFQTGGIVDQSINHPSALDQVREMLKQPDIIKKTINGLGEVTLTPSSGEIIIKPSMGALAGEVFKGNITPDGIFHFDLPPNSSVNLHAVQQTLENAGFTGVKVEDLPGKTITQDATEHFRKLNLIEKAHRSGFLDNGTPNIYDKNELRLHINVTLDGSVNLDMSHMIQENTIPATVNQDIITNPDGSKIYKNFEFLITANDAADNAREVIKIPGNPNGHAQILNNSDLHQFFDTSSGVPKQLARFIEVAHIEADGTRTIVATSVGRGIDYIITTATGIHTISATPPDLKEITHLYTLDLKPPLATELIPPTFESATTIPFIIPETGRPLIMTDRGLTTQEEPEKRQDLEFPSVAHITDEEMAELENKIRLIGTEQQDQPTTPTVTAEDSRRAGSRVPESSYGDDNLDRENLNHEVVSRDEERQILSRTEIHGFPFHGRRLTTEDLKNLDLVPTYKTTIEGSTVWFSPAYYSDNSGRVAVVGYVQDKNGQMIARTFYRSDSQGVWRYLPNYRLNKVGNINWYVKGYGEESIQLPIELQKALAEITKNKTGIFNISDRELVFAGTARNLNAPGTLYIEVHSVPQKLPGNFYEADPKKKISPVEIRFANQDDTPNFTKSLSSWTQETDLYGPITIEVFSSRNGKLKYMFCRDGKGRAWIGGIENNSPMQSVGLRQDWVTAGDLTTPGYEYPDQTAGYGNPADRKGSYVDMFENYLKHVPIIQEYLQSKQPLPSSPASAPIAPLPTSSTVVQETVKITDEDMQRAHVTDQELAETERWANSYTLGYVDLYNKSPEEKRRILEIFARRTREQGRLLESRYTKNLPPLSPTGTEGIHWERQTNPGMLTCQFSSSINALRALGVYDPQRHREQKFIEVLGGEEYARNHPGGAGTHDLDDIFHKLAPEVTIRRSNSVVEILEAVENGAAAIVELGPGHVGTILPGNRVLRSSNGQLQVQVLDPLSGVRIVPLDSLVKSNITLAGLPIASPGIIVEKASPTPADVTLTSAISIPETDIPSDPFSGNVATRLEVLEQFTERTTVETQAAYQRSLQEAIRLLEGKGGIIELQKGIPTIVLSDLHARRNFLANALKQKIGGVLIYDLLKRGKINVVCLGDGMHSEQGINWTPSRYETEQNVKGRPIYTEYEQLQLTKEKILQEQFNRNPSKYELDASRRSSRYQTYVHGDRVASDLRASKDPVFQEIEKKLQESYEREMTKLLDKEMTRSLGLMKMVMDLKAIAPNNFHYLKGNHDDILGGFEKFNSESKLVQWWTKNHYGVDFLQQWARFEKLLPILAKGSNFVLSHAAPFEPYTTADIVAREESVVGTKTVIAEDGKHHHRGLTWTDNTESDQMVYIARAIPGTLKNLGLPDKTTWIIGHRPIVTGTNFRSQIGGQLIQINDPDRQLIAYIPTDRAFDPDVDVKVLSN